MMADTAMENTVSENAMAPTGPPPTKSNTSPKTNGKTGPNCPGRDTATSMTKITSMFGMAMNAPATMNMRSPVIMAI